jgi:tetratricopeptide (TPR) repeat protein
LAVLVLVAAAYAVYRAVPKSPARIAAEHAATGDQLLARGDREGAAGAYERSLAANPGQAGVWATLSVLYALNGAEADADAALARARGLARRSGELPFLLSRTWEQVGEHGRALDEADAALAEDPRLAGAALVRASALEGLGRLDEALVAYTHAAQLALAEGDSTVYVSAQTRMGMLTQQGAAGLTPAPSD